MNYPSVVCSFSCILSTNFFITVVSTVVRTVVRYEEDIFYRLEPMTRTNSIMEIIFVQARGGGACVPYSGTIVPEMLEASH